MREKAKVFKVDKDSIAQEACIEPGDIVLSINNKQLKDIFDYHYSMSGTKLKLRIQKNNGNLEKIKIRKNEYEDIGIIFKDDLMNGEKSCTNKCIFCFVDQLPTGMRKSLYCKDDDARLSLLHGNYVTLTNTDMKELKRLARLHVSPINISVHTVNPELRVKMMVNRFAGDIMEKVKFLARKNIIMNCQIVLCREYNDGEELEKTIKTLAKLQPQINSLSVVPVGITRYRKSLITLKAFDKVSAIEVIDIIEKAQHEYKEKYGKNFVYAADEFYILASKNVPDVEAYDGFPQIENGVGLITAFTAEVREVLKTTKIEIEKKRKISIVTGMAAFEVMKKIAGLTEKTIKNIEINVYPVENSFFGKKVTVAGLLTGHDIIRTLRGKDLGEELLIPSVMLKADEDIFLDDVTLDEISEKIRVKVTSVYVDGDDYIKKVTGRKENV